MPISVRTAAVITAALVTTAMLASCSLLNPGPPRDPAGQISTTTTASVSFMLVGDCFNYTSDPAKVELTPCGESHTHKVLGQGTLTQADLDAAGGTQNAVSAACAEGFAAYKAQALAAGAPRPDQEFIVAEREVDEETVFAYSCVATDSLVTAAG